jgi:hypothetical protein
MAPETIAKFDALADCHKDILVGATHGDEVIWVNMCNLYDFRRDERAALKDYIASHAWRTQ